MMKEKTALFILTALLFCGCHSDQYYQNQAVERARKFLLQNTGDFNAAQINFVRFNPPVLLHAPVLGNLTERSSPLNLAHEQHQVCVTWIVPEKDDLYMVFGVSSARMADWQPNRIIKRSYRRNVAVIPQAAAKCVDYARENFFSQMDPEAINLVRFTMPSLYQGKFGLNLDPAGKADSAALEALRKEAAGKKQYALVWKLPGKNLVFAGLGEAGFKNWNIVMAGFFTDSELTGKLGMELMTSADYTKAFPTEKENPPAAVPANKVEEKK